LILRVSGRLASRPYGGARRTPSASINGTVASVVTNVMITNMVKERRREDAEIVPDVEGRECDHAARIEQDADRQRKQPRGCARDQCDICLWLPETLYAL